MLFAVYKVFAYYGSLALFGAVTLAFSGCCWLSGPAKRRARRERFFQRAIHREFLAFTRWLSLARLVRIEYRGFPPSPPPGRVIVANHPGLLDAVFLLARVPEGICIYKPAIRRNPLLGPAAVRAGYLAGDRGLGLVRSAARKIAEGASLVVFPEGTRTPAGGRPGPFKPGFALIARRASAPVQLVRITCGSDLLTKERACWKLPQLPARVVIETGPLLDANDASSTAIFVSEVEAWFRAAPAGHRAALAESVAAAPAGSTLVA